MACAGCSSCPGLRDLAQRIDALELRDLARCLSRRDRDRLAALLPALAGRFGSTPILVREVIASADPGVRLVRGDLNAKRIGRLFSRAAGLAVDGYVVERCGVEDGATIWSVRAVADFPRL